jgi:hypothetical protein
VASSVGPERAGGVAGRAVDPSADSTRAVRPSERALWTAVIRTLDESIRPSVADAATVHQIDRVIALATYARERDVDRARATAEHVARIVGADDVVDVLSDPGDARREPLRRVLRDELQRCLDEERVLLRGFGFVEDDA